MIGLDKQHNLKLRALEPEDLDFLYTIENDEDLWEVGNTNVPYSKYAISNYLLTTQNDIYADKQLRLVLEDDSNKPVGLIDLFNFSPSHLRADIGIAVVADVRNKGYGKEAVEWLVRYSKNVLHLHQLCAWVGAHNAYSLKLFHNAGFEQGARLKDWVFDGKHFDDVIVMQLFL
ncbi:MAG: GNAT family N-acetyltransferase [Prevotella sp.]|nr:GNAT family N-acetyltransferase [Prevotella sp.]